MVNGTWPSNDTYVHEVSFVKNVCSRQGNVTDGQRGALNASDHFVEGAL